jgi:outer membrane protein assembly factor BamB
MQSMEFPMQRARLATLTLLLTANVASAHNTGDETWQQWRGPGRDAQFARSPLPANPDWKAVPAWSVGVGAGHSSPVADAKGETVFVLSRLDDRELVTAFEIESGDELWQDSSAAEIGVNPSARSHGRFPRSTPLFNAGKLYTLGVSAILTCYEADSGRVLWRFDETPELDTTDGFCGTSMSPVFDDGHVYVHVGDDRGGELLAFDASNGKIVARWKSDGPGYASPVLAEIDGVRQLITLTDRRLVSFTLPDLELAWSLPFEDKWIENIVTPVVAGDVIIYSGVRRGTFAARPHKTDTGWEVETLWSNRDEPLYMSSPVLIGDTLLGLSQKRRGELVALDVASGATRWKSAEGLGDIATLMAAADRALVLTQNAQLLTGSVKSSGIEIEHTYQIGEGPLWTQPLFVPGGMLTKDATHLTRWKFEPSSE